MNEKEIVNIYMKIINKHNNKIINKINMRIKIREIKIKS